MCQRCEDQKRRHRSNKNKHCSPKNPCPADNVGKIDYSCAPTVRNIIEAHVQLTTPLVEFLCCAEKSIRQMTNCNNKNNCNSKNSCNSKKNKCNKSC